MGGVLTFKRSQEEIAIVKGRQNRKKSGEKKFEVRNIILERSLLQVVMKNEGLMHGCCKSGEDIYIAPFSRMAPIDKFKMIADL